MKTTLKFMSMIAIGVALTACNNKSESTTASDSLAMMEDNDADYIAATGSVVPGEYVDLNTGSTVYIVQDPQTGYAVDSIRRVPIEFYIDQTGDTLFQTGVVVNNAIIQSDGKWMLDDTKVKRDGDELKIKYSDGSKLKIDGDEIKMKDENGKIKIDDDTVKIKSN